VLSKSLNCPVNLIITDNYTNEVEAMKAGKIDVGEFGPLGYIFAHTVADAQPVAVFGDRTGKPVTYTAALWVPADSPIKTVADLKGKKIAINAFGSAVDLVLRVALKKAGLDPRRDVQIVEVTFPNIAPAIREKRVDCGVLVIPFLPAESAKGDLRALFTGGDTFGPSSVAFQVATDKFIREKPEVLRAFLDDFVQGLAWYYNPANREKALDLVAAFTKGSRDVLATYFITPRDYYRDPNGCVSVAAVQKPIDAMVAYKLIDKPVEAAKYMKLQYLPKPCRS
jgi:NitT/TauT family transport system substrate-binding protein